MNAAIQDLISGIPSVGNPELKTNIQARLDSLTKPPGSLGRLEEIAARYALMRGEVLPSRPRTALYVFCADHGIARRGVSAYPREVTPQMVLNFADGGAAINVLCRRAGIEARIVDVGVDFDFDLGLPILHEKVARGSRDMLDESAMSAEELEQALLLGARCAETAADEGFTVVAAGEMGIGNTTVAAALGAALTGADPEGVVGLGTGIDEPARKRKVDLVRQVLEARKPNRDNPLEVLQAVGGLEIAAMTGFFLGAAKRRLTVLIDGFIAASGALSGALTAPNSRDWMLFGHRSAEQGHRILLDAMDAKPLLELEMRLGEGTGAALAAELVDAAVALYREMATFSSAGVSEKA